MSPLGFLAGSVITLNMTPDGISTKDWNQVKDLACKIANVTCDEDETRLAGYTKQLHRLLQKLSEQYGERPSILATKADYTENVRQKLALLKRAYTHARERNDQANLTFVASSIAQVYVEELENIRNGTQWLHKLREHLEAYPDDTERKEFRRLQKRLTAQSKGRASLKRPADRRSGISVRRSLSRSGSPSRHHGS